MRIETGAVQFGDDWPCVSIRGDNAMWYNMQLELLLNKVEETELAKDYAMAISTLRGLQGTLSGCNARSVDQGKSECQFLKPFEECVKPQEKNNE